MKRMDRIAETTFDRVDWKCFDFKHLFREQEWRAIPSSSSCQILSVGRTHPQSRTITFRIRVGGACELGLGQARWPPVHGTRIV